MTGMIIEDEVLTGDFTELRCFIMDEQKDIYVREPEEAIINNARIYVRKAKGVVYI